MKIIISGSHGFLGTALIPFLKSQGHQITRLVRSPELGSVVWNTLGQNVDTEKLEGYDAVIHLAGEGIASGRWTKGKKKRIRDSRVLGTTFLCETLAKLKNPPKAILCASAIGFYGDRGEEVLDEQSNQGNLFLSGVCQEWEKATAPAAQKGIRVVSLRFGVILSPQGGALAKMLPPFRMGVGGTLGSGKQFMSWISLDDTIGAITHALTTDSLRGPVNVVAPHAVINAEFTKTLGRVLKRPTIFPMPAFAARLVFGEMANELLLASTRVVPKELQRTHYRFQYPELEGALKHLL